MRRIVLLLFFAATTVLQAQETKNALLIILDDMNDYIGVMGGHPQAITPNIDRLAGEGVFFANAHSNAPICAPSRASFLSGLYPSTTGNFGFGHIADNPVLTNSKFIMEYAAENGFNTYSTGKIFHKSGDDRSEIQGKKQDQGPYAWDGANAIPHPSVPEPFRNVGLLNGSFAPLSDVPPGGWRNNTSANSAFSYISESNRDKMCDELSADFICQWIDELEELDSDTPFFMAYGGMKPHTPHVVPQRFFDMFPLDQVLIPEILKNDLVDTYYKNFSISGFSDFDSLLVSYSTEEEGLRRYVQSKLACIAFADSLVGVIVEKIESSTFADNTVVVLCGDNGFHMGEKFRLAKNTLWEESTRVPLIVKAPGFAASKGAVVSHPVGLIDIYPTFQDLCGMSGDTKKNAEGADIDGFSLRAFLENPETEDWDGPDVALESVVNPSSLEIGLQNYALRSEKYRYIHYPTGEEELYDHSLDYNEWTNLIFDPEYASIIQEFRDELKRLVPEVSFEKRVSVPYLFFDDFESYTIGDDLLTKGYTQKPGEATTTTLVNEDENSFARNNSVDGSIVNMRKKVKDLVPGKVYFFEAKTRTESSVTAGSWETLEPKTITGHTCIDWEWFSIPLIPDADSWTNGTSMNLFINSAQNKQLDVDSIKFYAATLEMEPAKGFDVNNLLMDMEYQFEASAIPANELFSWSVINGTGSASITTEGKLTTLASGSVQVVATMVNYPSVNCTTDLKIWDETIQPIITIEELDEEVVAGMPYQLSASLNPELDIPILWSVDDNAKAIINQTTGFLLTKSSGTITVTARLYGKEDISTSIQISIGETIFVKDIKTSDFTIYPNPSNGIFHIDGDGATAAYKVYDTNGKLALSSYGETLNLGSFPKGIYYLVIDRNNMEKIILK